MYSSTMILILSLAVASLAGQQVGEEAPEIVWQKTFGFAEGIPTRQLSELRGSVVWLEFMTTYEPACIARTGHLNLLHATHAQRGLVVLSVANEEEEAIASFIRRREIKYQMALGFGNDYRMELVPHVFLIDKDGKLAWRGHPSKISNAKLNELLVGARPATVRAGLEQVHRLRMAGQTGEAYVLAKQLIAGKLSAAAQEQAKGWMAEAEQFVATSMAAADEIEKQPTRDVYSLFAKLDPVARNYVGVPGGEKAKERLAALVQNKKDQQEIDAGRAWDEARLREAEFDFDGAIAIYKHIGEKLGRTKAGKDAKLRHRELIDKGMLGYDHECPYCQAGEVACPSHHRKK